VDLDLLVSRQDLPAVRRCLDALGYKEKETVENEVLFQKPVGGSSLLYLLEVHFEILNLWNFPHYGRVEDLHPGAIRERAQTEPIEGQPFTVLNPEDTLIHACIHFFYHHNFRGLKYFSDIDAILAGGKKQIDWEKLARIAGKSRVRQKLFLVLDTHRRLFPGSAVPRRDLEKLCVSKFRARLFRKALPPPEALPFGEPGSSHHLPMVLALDRIRDMVYITIYWFFPGKTFLQGYYRVQDADWRARLHFKYALAILRKGFRRLFFRESNHSW
jgi:hypothetical protein